MVINAQGYFDCMHSYLNIRHYALPIKNSRIILKENVFTATGEKEMEVKLQFNGEVFGIKLDKKNKKGNCEPLFHFLDDEAKPWASRCDFIIFHCYRNKIKAYLFEFKSKTISADSIVRQLNAGEAWCKSLVKIIKIYTNKSKKISLTKFVLTLHTNPAAYLGENGKYLKADSSIRHYNYDDIQGINLSDLENSHEEAI